MDKRAVLLCVYCQHKGSLCTGCNQVVCSTCDILESPLDPYDKDGNEICHVPEESACA